MVHLVFYKKHFFWLIIARKITSSSYIASLLPCVSSLKGRTERYNHEIDTEDTEDDAEDILFHSFSSCSPRYSKVYSKIEELHHDVSWQTSPQANSMVFHNS